MLLADGTVRPHYAAYCEWLGSRSADWMERKRAEADLDREGRMGKRRALQLGDRGGGPFRIAGLGRGLCDAGERERQHPDRVAVAQQRRALPAEA